ncbi:MAG: beta-lactamase family protein [Candidatus Muirbacterium halophilum]|nr:beta-lactamase family protein [Candidatus Muirbacterium halophilum]MCK9475226.1 beta-lactamase family protein [Candidatus Muirbacterium halophilum]
MKKFYIFILLIVIFAIAGYFFWTNFFESPVKTENPIFKFLSDKCYHSLNDDKGNLKGLIIGIVNDNDVNIYGYGKINDEDINIPDGNSEFGIASLTKTFTGLLLAKLSVKGIVDYDDTAVLIKDKPVTFRQLVTHTSGLPWMPSNVKDDKDYTKSDLKDFIKDYELSREPGSKFEYSSAGFAVLGMVLAEKSKYKSFENALENEIIKPLSLKHTSFNAITPFNAGGRMISCVNDLSVFLKANMYSERFSELKNAIFLTQKKSSKMQTFPGSVATLGWELFNDNIYWHSGTGSGCTSFMAFDKNKDYGIIVAAFGNIQTSNVAMASFTLLGGIVNSNNTSTIESFH